MSILCAGHCTTQVLESSGPLSPSSSTSMGTAPAAVVLHVTEHLKDEPRACTIIIFIQVLALLHRAQVLT